ncbi:MAG: hypothetical protein DRP79_09400, partial [Planctomycetota bacterium]
MEFLKLWEIMARRKWLIIITFSVFLATVIAGTYLVTPIYEAKAKVLVEPSESLSSLMSSLGLTAAAGKLPTTVEETHDTDIALITMRPLLETLISNLSLTDRDGKVLKPEDLVKSSLFMVIFPRPYTEVQQYEESNILEIISQSASPEEAANMSNELARLYIEDRLERKRKEYKAAHTFIENRINEIKEKYYDSLVQKRDFMIKEETVDLSKESSATLAVVSALENDYRDNEIAVAEANEQIVFLEEKIGKGEYASVTIADRWESTLDDLLLEVSGKQVQFTAKDPDVSALNQKIDTLKKIVKEKAKFVVGEKQMSMAPVYAELVRSLKDAYINKKVGEIKRNLLKEYIGKAKDRLIQIPSKVIKQSELELALSSYQSVYANLLEYLTQVGIAESVTISNIKVVEPATAPDPDKPEFPNRALCCALGVFLGLFLAFSLALFAEYLDNTIKSPADIEGFRFTFLGSIPGPKRFKRKRLISKTDSNDPVYEAYRKILSSIHFARLDKPPKKLLITSIEPKAGSSTVAANLGILCAKEGKQVLMVDTDLRRPDLHHLSGCPNKEGLTSVLLENKDVEKVIWKSRIDGLSILTAGPKPPDPGLLLKSDKLRKVIV